MIELFKQLCSSHTKGHHICHHCLLTCKASGGTLLPTWAHWSLGQAEQRVSITEMPLPTEEWERWRNQTPPVASWRCSSPLVAAVAHTTSHWDPKDSLTLPLGMGQPWHPLTTHQLVCITLWLLCGNKKQRKWVLSWHFVQKLESLHPPRAQNSFSLFPETEDVKTVVHKHPAISKGKKPNPTCKKFSFKLGRNEDLTFKNERKTNFSQTLYFF